MIEGDRSTTAINAVNNLRRSLEPLLSNLEELYPIAATSIFVFSIPNTLRDIDRFLGHIIQTIHNRPAPLSGSFTVQEATDVVLVVQRSQHSLQRLQECVRELATTSSYAQLDSKGSDILAELRRDHSNLQSIRDAIEREVEAAKSAAVSAPPPPQRSDGHSMNHLAALLASLLSSNSASATAPPTGGQRIPRQSQPDPARLAEEYSRGHHAGLTEGEQKGYRNGLAEGKQNGYREGLSEGHQNGHRNGLAEGRKQGSAEAIVTMCQQLRALHVFANPEHESTPLMRAVLRGSVEGIDVLHQLEVDLNQPSLWNPPTRNSGRQWLPLCAAIKQDDLAVVGRLLDLGAEVQQHEPDGNNALLTAAEVGNVDILNLLFEGGASELLEKRHRSGCYENYTPLGIAVLQGNVAAMELLFQKHTLAGATPTMYHTPLRLACERGRYKIVKFLLRQGVDVNSVDSVDGQTALHVAVRCNQADIVRLLLASGANHQAKDKQHFTPLLLAINQAGSLRNRDQEAASLAALLIEAGAECEDNNGQYSALIHAVSKGRANHVKVLLDKGANVHYVPHRSSHMKPALHCALEKSRFEIANHLMDAGADIGISTGYFPCPVAKAIQDGNQAALECVLNRPRHSEILRKWSATKPGPIEVAITHEQTDLIHFLLERGADIDFAQSTLDESEYTALHHAAKMLNYEAVDVLLKAGADPLRITKSGRCNTCSSPDRLKPRVAGLYPRCFLENMRGEVEDDARKNGAFKVAYQLLLTAEGNQGPKHLSPKRRRPKVTPSRWSRS